MSILDWFDKKNKTFRSKSSDKLNIPGNLWVKCPSCGNVVFKKDLDLNFMVCNHCGYHFRILPKQRLKYFFDKDSFSERDTDLSPKDFLEFVDTESYSSRIKKAAKKSDSSEAVVTGSAKLNNMSVSLAIMDFSYMGGSMGTVVGEKITRTIEYAIKHHEPVIIFTMSGGARMQEGILSLMQMAKTSAALTKLSDAKLPYISVLCDPTTGGTSASFAMLGDVHIAEPDALISFAGPRVIEQTIKQKLPKGFQRSDFLLERGMIDMVIERKKLKDTLYSVLLMLYDKGQDNGK